MKDAQKQQRMMRDKRLKAVQYGQSGGGHGGGWQGQHSYASVACAAQYGTGPSCTRSGTPYGMWYFLYTVISRGGLMNLNVNQDLNSIECAPPAHTINTLKYQHSSHLCIVSHTYQHPAFLLESQAKLVPIPPKNH